jgi:hypothetical protein
MVNVGEFLTNDAMTKVKIPQAQTAEFIVKALNVDDLALFKREIFGNSNCIRLSEPPAGKLKLWLEEEGKDLYSKSNSTFPWAAKNKPGTKDTGHEHLCGILYFGHFVVDGVISVSMMTIFDIANADVLLGPSKACPRGELVSTLTEEIDAMYKLYTCLYQKETKVTRVVEMLQHAILHRCANVMEILTTQNLIRSTDTAILRRFLAICLHRIFRSCIKSHVFRYDWSYVELFCHCVRHNTVKRNFADDTIEISNRVAGAAEQVVLPNKLYVNITVCLVNIIDAVTNNKTTIKLPKQIAEALGVAITEEFLPKDLLDTLRNLNISDGKK